MKNFKKFLEEVTIKGNPGVPGEGPDRDRNDINYLSNIERRAKDRLGIDNVRDPRPLFSRIMQLSQESQSLIRGKETEIENLAKEVILNNFGDILDDVELDIKIVKSGSDVKRFMDEEEDDDTEKPNFRQISDSELIKRIHKAKLGNIIIQGEAKNTKHILHAEEVKEGLSKIFGRNSDRIFRIWDEMTKIADKLDWIIPINIKADMMERAPEGMAGAVSVGWKPKDWKPKEGKNIEDSEEEDSEDDLEESYTPVIKARGIDFPMLLHETVKGIFELIASVSQPGMDASPEEIEKAETVKYNVSSFEDEAEDFRTGPEIAADFRDFINVNAHSNDYPNIRAHIFGLMMDPNYMSSDEFLKLFRGILNKTPEARRKVDSMIDEIIEKIKEYELGEIIDSDSDDFESDSDIDSLISNKSDDDEKELSKKELQEEIDAALDSGNMNRFKKLSQEYSKRFPE